MHRLIVATALALVTLSPAEAQSWVPWHQPDLLKMYDRGRHVAPRKEQPPPVAKRKRQDSRSRLGGALPPPAAAAAPVPTGLTQPAARTQPPPAPVIADGGPRPRIKPRAPKSINFRSGHPVGTVLIDTAARRLYLVRSATKAYSYPISVGREGFAWNGSEKISRVADWPDWHPPAEMRERDPRLPVKMTGGVRNPLGAKALYLGSTLYRIHGTSDARSIGRAASSGCFRMHNGHVVDLASRIGIGARVIVYNAPEVPKKTAAAR